MTRDEAIKTIRREWHTSASVPESLVDILTGLGLLKLDEATKSADTTIIRQKTLDALCAHFDTLDVSIILNCLARANLNIVEK